MRDEIRDEIEGVARQYGCRVYAIEEVREYDSDILRILLHKEADLCAGGGNDIAAHASASTGGGNDIAAHEALGVGASSDGKGALASIQPNIAGVENSTKPTSVTLDLCEQISRTLSPLLDVLDPDGKPYVLEVGSKGLLRKIATLEQFAMSINDSVALVLNDGTKIKGVVRGVSQGNIMLLSDGELINVSFSQIRRAKSIFADE